MPANLVSAQAVTKSVPTGLLLDRVSLGVAAGERIGVVGRNGSGKTTLVGLLAKAVEPDDGRVTHTSGLRLGYLRQGDELPPGETIRAVVLGAAAEHEWAGDAGIREVLDGLGLSALGLDAPVGPLSGGERRRVALAGLLVHALDLLILDEPTNHLDVDGIDWLARHLAGRPVALVAVTHDRWFLDAVCTRTWEIAAARVHAYAGGYSAYVLAHAERIRLAATVEARRQGLLRKELAWLRRGPPARTSKPAFRVAAAEALIADEPPARDEVALRTFAAARLGKSVYDVEDVTVQLGDRTLLDRLTWLVGPGDRIGVVGANGSGKTTLLRLLVGQVLPAAGRVRTGATVRAAYLSQDVEELDPALRVLSAVEEVARVVDLDRGREISAAALLEEFGLGGGTAWTRLGDLSGGVRRRVQLLRLLLAAPNVLLLDEPTNDLDVDTLRALEDLLDSWAGTLVVVSHDRYFLERVCERTLALLGDGRLVELPGGVDDYLARRSAPRVDAAEHAALAPARRRTGERRAVRKELARLERELARIEAREARLHDELAAHAADYQRVSRLDAELRALIADKQRAEDAWLTVSDQLD